MDGPRKTGILRHQFRTLFRELGRGFTAREFAARFPERGTDIDTYHQLLATARRNGQLAVIRREPVGNSKLVTLSYYVPVFTPGMDGR